MFLLEQLHTFSILPVVTASSVVSTVQLARVLHDAGMKAIEITLRTDNALECIRAVKAEVPGLLVAAGTVNTPYDLEQVQEAGVEFALSPGSTAGLLQAAATSGLPFVPGVATASEVMQGLEHGFKVFKLFPAVHVGGLSLLKSLAGPFPYVRFCPTGGLTADNFRNYLALDNVCCCGGSWMVDKEFVDSGDWDKIASLVRATMIT